MRKNSEEDFWKHIVKKPNGCWIWTGFCNPQGYGFFSWQGKNHLAHRLSLQFSGVDVTDKIACHHCDTPSCCNPDHLYAGTKQSNSDDARSRNRLRRSPGSSNPNAKLSEQEVLHIRNIPYKQAVALYSHKVSVGHICTIKYTKKGWHHIQS